jgi:serine O-acetyltransferase
MVQRRNQDRYAAVDGSGRLAAKLFRLSQRRPLGPIYSNVLRFAFGLEMPRRLTPGPGLRLPHGARGTVIHWDSKIGSHVAFHHNVTLGVRRTGGGAPTIDDDVEIGPGAVILGEVTIGQGAQIGANAVVLTDVPAGATAVGNPARIIAGR